MTCRCLCFAVHASLNICDVDAPRALVTVATAGSALGDQGPSDVLMCQPCAEAAAAVNPRVLGVVVLPADDDAAE